MDDSDNEDGGHNVNELNHEISKSEIRENSYS